MSDARNRILARLKTRTPPVSTAPAPGPHAPDWDTGTMVRRFSERMEAVRAKVHVVGTDDWPLKLAELAVARGTRSLLYGAGGPLAAHLENGLPTEADLQLVPYSDPVEKWKERLFFETDAAFTSTLGGIAETGTLILWPTPEEPRLMSLVPPVHFAVLSASDLHPTFAAAMAEQRWAEQMPTNALLISGPSKSADIEQTLAYGVHGPRELVILLVEDQTESPAH